VGLSSEPSGAVIVIGRLTPSLNGMSGLVRTDLRQLSAAETVDENGQLRLRATCLQVPAKSMATVLPLIVTLALTVSGSSVMPSSSTASSP
jgi:hypothetical protein